MPHGLRPLLSCSLFSVVPLCRTPPRARRRCWAPSEPYLFKICASSVRLYLFDGSEGRKRPSEEEEKEEEEHREVSGRPLCSAKSGTSIHGRAAAGLMEL